MNNLENSHGKRFPHSPNFFVACICGVSSLQFKYNDNDE